MNQGMSWSGNEANCAFLNLGEKSFSDISIISGLNHLDDGRAAASVDIDFDGDLDLLVTARTSPRFRILINNSNLQNNFIQFYTPEIGTRIKVFIKDQNGEKSVLVQTRKAGRGYLAQSSSWLHFGLGRHEVTHVEIEWPNKSKKKYTQNFSNKRYLIDEDKKLTEWEPPSYIENKKSDAEKSPKKALPNRLILSHGLPMPEISVKDSQDRFITLFGTGTSAVKPGPENTATLLVIWNSNTGSVPPLSEDDLKYLNNSKVKSILLSPKESRPTNWKGFYANISNTQIKIFDLITRATIKTDAPLPRETFFLIDNRGNLIGIYFDRKSLRLAITEDVDKLHQKSLSSLPLTGTWISEKPQGSLLPYEKIFTSNNMLKTAQEFQPGYISLQMGKAYLDIGKHKEALQSFLKASEEGPYFTQSYLGMGLAYEALKDYKSASLAYQQALIIDKNNKEAQKRLERIRSKSSAERSKD